MAYGDLLKRIGIALMPGLFLIFALSFSKAAGAQPNQTSADGRKAAEEIPAENLISLDPRKATFKIVQGEGEGKLVPMTLKASTKEGEWSLAFENLYRLLIFRAPDGAVQVHSMELMERNERVEFQPAFVLIPARIKAGQRTRRSGRVQVYDIEAGNQAYSGSYTEIIKELSRSDFNTPTGTIDGYLLEYEFEIRLDYADIRIDLANGWSKDQRLIFWRSKRTVSKLGLFGETTQRSMAVTNVKAGD